MLIVDDSLPRVRRRSSPAEWDPDEPMTLTEAVAVFFPEGPLSVASLRTEIRKGRLRASKVAGRLFVTPADLRSLFAPERWAGLARDRGFTCGTAGSMAAAAAVSPPSTSSATGRFKLAQAAARTALHKLSRH